MLVVDALEVSAISETGPSAVERFPENLSNPTNVTTDPVSHIHYTVAVFKGSDILHLKNENLMKPLRIPSLLLTWSQPGYKMYLV